MHQDLCFTSSTLKIPLLRLPFCVTHVEDDSLTPQSPVPSPIMAAGSKFRSSRLKSLLILSVKSLFFSALQLWKVKFQISWGSDGTCWCHFEDSCGRFREWGGWQASQGCAGCGDLGHHHHPPCPSCSPAKVTFTFVIVLSFLLLLLFARLIVAYRLWHLWKGPLLQWVLSRHYAWRGSFYDNQLIVCHNPLLVSFSVVFDRPSQDW